MGNRDPRAVPHGAFPCKGEDSWCTIAIWDDQEWRNFCEAIGKVSWARDAKFANFLSRKEHEEELERLVGEWTLQHDAEEVMALLQSAGVKAGVVRGIDFILDGDPHLRERGYFVPVPHPTIGTLRYPLAPVRLSSSPLEVGPPPCLGEHNEYVCTQILGISDEMFIELVANQVFV